MTKLLLLVAVIVAVLATAAAQTRYCGSAFFTCRSDGMPEGTNEPYTTCTTANAKTMCTGGLNPKCTMSVRAYKTICCYDVSNPVTPVTPDPGSTFATPTVTPLIRNLKPLCPNGALGYGPTGNLVLPCNRTNLVKAGCPNSNYTCTRAVNVYDVYGTPADLSDDVGAGDTPDICCQTATLTSQNTVLTSAGLTPAIVPTTMVPPAGIASFFLPAPVAANVYPGDDRSEMPINQLTTLDAATITLFSKTTAATRPDRYHVLFFDATTNKDLAFYANLPGSDSYKLTLPAAASVTPIATNSTGDNLCAVVYTSDTTSALASKLYRYSATYSSTASPPAIFGPANEERHKFVLLVWKTTMALDFGAANATVAASARIQMGVGIYADFVPVTDKATNGGATTGGIFTTVSAFLAGKAKTVLKTPIAGTYFWFKK